MEGSSSIPVNQHSPIVLCGVVDEIIDDGKCINYVLRVFIFSFYHQVYIILNINKNECEREIMFVM